MTYIEKYVRWLAAREGVPLEEAASRSLKRVLKLFADKTKSIIVISAFRHERTLIDNRKKSVELARTLRAGGWGFIQVIGGFPETVEARTVLRGNIDDDTEDRVDVQEDSYITTLPGNTSQNRIKKVAMELMNKFDQDAVLIKFGSDVHGDTYKTNVVYMYENTGKMTVLGVPKEDPELLGRYYTQTRKGPPGRQFVLEAASDETLSTRRCVDMFKYY